MAADHIAVTIVAAYLMAWVLLIIGVVLFDTPTPECTDSDTCGAWGDFAYNWPGQIVCLVLGAVIAWRALPIRR